MGVGLAGIDTSVPAPRLPLSDEQRVEEAQKIYRESGVNVLADFPGIFDLEVVNAVNFPHDSLVEAYESGCAEPWVSQLVSSLLVASNQRVIFEGGGFTGQTSGWLAMTLQKMGGGELIIAELEPERAQKVKARLEALPIPDVQYRILQGDVLRIIPHLPKHSIGFAWIDDNHESYHVQQELYLLWDRMKPGGIITGHDVWGRCNLQKVFKHFGGLSLNLPRLGPAGGIGMIQVPNEEMLQAPR